jgi:hypothetical protein
MIPTQDPQGEEKRGASHHLFLHPLQGSIAKSVWGIEMIFSEVGRPDLVFASGSDPASDPDNNPPRGSSKILHANRGGG